MKDKLALAPPLRSSPAGGSSPSWGSSTLPAAPIGRSLSRVSVGQGLRDRWRRHGFQPGIIGIDRGQLPPDVLFNDRNLRGIVFARETHGRPGCPGPPRSADPMDVVLRAEGEIVIHDMTDGFDMKTTRGNVRRHQNPELSGPEIFQCLNPFCLVDVS